MNGPVGYYIMLDVRNTAATMSQINVYVLWTCVVLGTAVWAGNYR